MAWHGKGAEEIEAMISQSQQNSSNPSWTDMFPAQRSVWAGPVTASININRTDITFSAPNRQPCCIFRG